MTTEIKTEFPSPQFTALTSMPSPTNLSHFDWSDADGETECNDVDVDTHTTRARERRGGTYKIQNVTSGTFLDVSKTPDDKRILTGKFLLTF